MPNINLSTEHLARLLKFLRLLGSDKVGERAAAGLKAHELVERLGGWDAAFLPAPTYRTYAPPPPPPRPPQFVEDLGLWQFAMDHLDADAITDWDEDFVVSIGNRLKAGTALSDKQRVVLKRICAKAGG